MTTLSELTFSVWFKGKSLKLNVRRFFKVRVFFYLFFFQTALSDRSEFFFPSLFLTQTPSALWEYVASIINVEKKSGFTHQAGGLYPIKHIIQRMSHSMLDARFYRQSFQQIPFFSKTFFGGILKRMRLVTSICCILVAFILTCYFSIITIVSYVLYSFLFLYFPIYFNFS